MILLTCAEVGISRNKPVPVRSLRTTLVKLRATSTAFGVSAINTGTAKGIGSMTPCVISIRSGAADNAPLFKIMNAAKISRNIIYSSSDLD